LKDRKDIKKINMSKEKEIIKRCPQKSCCTPGLWNIQFDPLLKITYTKQKKGVAFVGDLLIIVKSRSVGEAKIIAKVELNKISKWARDN